MNSLADLSGYKKICMVQDDETVLAFEKERYESRGAQVDVISIEALRKPKNLKSVLLEYGIIHVSDKYFKEIDSRVREIGRSSVLEGRGDDVFSALGTLDWTIVLCKGYSQKDIAERSSINDRALSRVIETRGDVPEGVVLLNIETVFDNYMKNALDFHREQLKRRREHAEYLKRKPAEPPR